MWGQISHHVLCVMPCMNNFKKHACWCLRYWCYSESTFNSLVSFFLVCNMLKERKELLTLKAMLNCKHLTLSMFVRFFLYVTFYFWCFMFQADFELWEWNNILRETDNISFSWIVLISCSKMVLWTCKIYIFTESSSKITIYDKISHLLYI